MKVTMNIIDDGNIDQRKLYRLVTKAIRTIFNGEENNSTSETDLEYGGTNNAPSTNNTINYDSRDKKSKENIIRSENNSASADDGDSIFVSVVSIKYEEGERRNDLKSLSHKNHSLKLVVATKNNTNNEAKVQYVPFSINHLKAIEWNLSCVEPFSRNEQRIYEIYSKGLLCGWSAASLRVSAILIMDIISNTLLIIDAARGAENITAYRYARGRSIQSVTTIIILSTAILVTIMQMYAVAFTRLRTCPSLTVFAVPPFGFASTTFKKTSVGADEVFMDVVPHLVLLYAIVLLFLVSPAVAWGALIVALIVTVLSGIKLEQDDAGQHHDRALLNVETVMWGLELNTAFYLPFAHATSTATLVASVIDAAAEFLELSNSLVGSIGGKNLEVGEGILLRPGASEEEIMWSYMNQNASQFVEVVMETDTLSKTDKTVELERFVMLLNYFSLDGAGTWSILAGSPTSWQLELNGGVGKFRDGWDE